MIVLVVVLHWFGQFLHPGKVSYPGGGYWFWSGIGSGSPVFVLLVGYWSKHNCHVHRCWRLSWHPSDKYGGHIVCRHHHEHSGSGVLKEK